MRYGTTTTSPPADVFRLARERFGAAGSGLRLTGQSLDAAEFTSTVGSLRIEARRLPDGITEVVIATREHDAEARALLFALPRQGLWERLRARLRSYRKPRTTP